MDKLSHALNLGSQRIPSSNSRLRRPTKGVPPPYLYCVYTLADLSGQLGYFQDSMAPARMQTRIIPTAPGILSVSARKLCLLSEKYFFLSETDNAGQYTNDKRTIALPVAARSLAKFRQDTILPNDKDGE